MNISPALRGGCGLKLWIKIWVCQNFYFTCPPGRVRIETRAQAVKIARSLISPALRGGCGLKLTEP